jgi:hypothetical protein
MKEDFHLIDLISQAGAVQPLLRGKSTEEKIEWLSAHGTIYYYTQGYFILKSVGPKPLQ